MLTSSSIRDLNDIVREEFQPVSIVWNCSTSSSSYRFSCATLHKNITRFRHLFRFDLQHTRAEWENGAEIDIQYRPYIWQAKLLKISLKTHVSSKNEEDEKIQSRPSGSKSSTFSFKIPKIVFRLSKVCLFLIVFYPIIWVGDSVVVNVIQYQAFRREYPSVLWAVYAIAVGSVVLDHLIDCGIIFTIARPMKLDCMLGDFFLIFLLFSVLCLPLVFKSVTETDNHGNSKVAKALEIDDYFALVALSTANIVMNRLLENVIQRAIADRTIYLEELQNIGETKRDQRETVKQKFNQVRMTVQKTLADIGLLTASVTQGIERNAANMVKNVQKKAEEGVDSFCCCLVKVKKIQEDLEVVEDGFYGVLQQSPEQIQKIAEKLELSLYSTDREGKPLQQCLENVVANSNMDTDELMKVLDNFSTRKEFPMLGKVFSAMKDFSDDEQEFQKQMDAKIYQAVHPDGEIIDRQVNNVKNKMLNKVTKAGDTILKKMNIDVNKIPKVDIEAMEDLLKNELEDLFRYGGKTRNFRILLRLKLLVNIAAATLYLFFSSIYFTSTDTNSLIWVLFLSITSFLNNITTAVCIKSHDDTVKKIYQTENGAKLGLEIGSFNGFSQVKFYTTVLLSFANLVYQAVTAKSTVQS